MSPTTVLITGANSGIGYATAQVLAEQTFPTFHVILAARTIEKAEGAKASLESSGKINGQLFAVQLDVTDSESIKRAATHVQQTFGHLDVLINNAGVASIDGDLRTRYRTCLETNVIGPALVSESFRPLVLKSEDPVSMYISSSLGSVASATVKDSPTWPATVKIFSPNADAYCVSKAAVNMLAMQERGLYSDKKLRVYSLCPGFVRSNIRGTSEEAVSANGMAGDPLESGRTVLGIIRRERETEDGKFLHKDGVYPW